MARDPETEYCTNTYDVCTVVSALIKLNELKKRIRFFVRLGAKEKKQKKKFSEPDSLPVVIIVLKSHMSESVARATLFNTILASNGHPAAPVVSQPLETAHSNKCIY